LPVLSLFAEHQHEASVLGQGNRFIGTADLTAFEGTLFTICNRVTLCVAAAEF
jgi:hypothetical protein